MTYGEAPGAEKTSAESRNKIIHARIDFGGQFLLGADMPGEHYHTPQGFNVMAAVEQPAEAERIFRTLAEGGKVTMPVQETFWAHRLRHVHRPVRDSLDGQLRETPGRRGRIGPQERVRDLLAPPADDGVIRA